MLLGTSYSTGRATLVRLASYIAHCKVRSLLLQVFVKVDILTLSFLKIACRMNMNRDLCEVSYFRGLLFMISELFSYLLAI